jgi:hypothetical protein
MLNLAKGSNLFASSNHLDIAYNFSNVIKTFFPIKYLIVGKCNDKFLTSRLRLHTHIL